MNIRNFRYDTRDFGKMGHPPITADNLISPDFGAAQKFGCPQDQIGAMDQGSYSYADNAGPDSELTQMEVQAANDKVAALQVQISQLQNIVTSNNSVATRAQIIALQNEMAVTKASLPFLDQIKHNLPYIAAAGVGIIFLGIMLGRRK